MSAPRVVPEPMWGWGTGVKEVKVETVENTPGHRSVQAVTVDGTFVGHVVGRPESALKARRWWGYAVGDDDTREVTLFGVDSRQIAISNLISAASRRGLI